MPFSVCIGALSYRNLMLSVILPTYNESANIQSILHEVCLALKHMPFEVIVVDDNSPDETWRIAEECGSVHPQVRVIRRMHERGLSTAVIAGFNAAKGHVLAVMDADGQHDSGLLSVLYNHVKQGADIAIGSRYIPGGSVGQWDGYRQAMSRFATRLAVRLCGVTVKDPMSGFFAIAKPLFVQAQAKMNPKGFKILLDILMQVPKSTRIDEVPLKFGLRRAGESKLNWRVKLEFLQYIYESTVGRYVSFPVACLLLVSVFIAAVLVPRLIGIQLLYTNADVRSQTLQHLQQSAKQEGWLLSDIAFTSVTQNSIEFLHTPHGRLSAMPACHRIIFGSQQALPCDGSR